MKKCVCFLKKNYHYIILLLTFAATLFVTFSADLFGDDYFYMKPAVSSFPVILQFLKWHIMKCNGRTLVHIFVLLFLRNSFTVTLWRILSAAALTALCWIIPKLLFADQKLFRLGVCAASFILMTVRPNMYNQPVYWLTGSINYLFPILLLVVIMFISLKKENSKWLFPLAFLCGATVEQIGMMCIGWFVLLILNKMINKIKLNKHLWGYLILSIAGFLTIVFSPGTFTRMTNQGELNEQSFFTVLLAMARKNWLDNISIYSMVILLSVSFCLWAYCFRKKNAFAGIVAKIIMPVFTLLFILNSLLRVYVTFYGMFLQRDVNFSEKTNRIFMFLWIIYLALFVFLSLYSAVMIYIEKHNFVPISALILAYGSQLMMVITKTVLFRTCFPALIFFAVYLTYSYAMFANRLSNSESAKQSKKLLNLGRCVVCLACVFACAFQLYSGAYGECLFKEEKKSFKPYSHEEMQQMLDQMDISIKEYYSSENSDLKLKYDPYDFSLYK